MWSAFSTTISRSGALSPNDSFHSVVAIGLTYVQSTLHLAIGGNEEHKSSLVEFVERALRQTERFVRMYALTPTLLFIRLVGF